MYLFYFYLQVESQPHTRKIDSALGYKPKNSNMINYECVMYNSAPGKKIHTRACRNIIIQAHFSEYIKFKTNGHFACNVPSIQQ